MIFEFDDENVGRAVAALVAREAAMRDALESIGEWDHRGDAVSERWDEINGAGSWAALLASAPGEAPALAEAPASIDSVLETLDHLWPQCAPWESHQAINVEALPRLIEAMRSAAPAEAPAPAQTLCGYPSCDCKRDPPPDPAYCAKGFPTREAPAVPSRVLARIHEQALSLAVSVADMRLDAIIRLARSGGPLYDAAALASARASGRREGIEDAAKVCDEMAAGYTDDASKASGFEIRNAYRMRAGTATYAADAIRALP